MIDLGGFICYPYSTILASMTFLRFYFVFKLFKHGTKWTSVTSERVCEKYVCKADTRFAFKAFQKENPFLILSIIFVSTCLCFGLSLRNFERFYWETKPADGAMDWDYAMNAMWCIFVSMTTVGYGDFYSKTSIGRVLTIFACLIGNYFVSMMMVFMTQKSGLNDYERKAFNLISRLKMRNHIREYHSFIVNHALLMVRHKVRKKNDNTPEKAFQIRFSYEKRKIQTFIDLIKNKMKIIHTFESLSLKERLYDISERIDSDIRDIKRETENLRLLNEIIINFTDCQIENAKNLKKNCYATKMMYVSIGNKKIFGKLNNVDLSLQNLFTTMNPSINNRIGYSEIFTNFNDEEFEDNIFNYEVDDNQIREYFDFLLKHNKSKKTLVSKASRTLDFIKKKKTMNNVKLQRIQRKIQKKKDAKHLMSERNHERMNRSSNTNDTLKKIN